MDLIESDDVQARSAEVSLLDESGNGSAFVRPTQPGQHYFTLPHAYWLNRYDQRLDLPGKAALLISRSLKPDTFTLPLETASEWYGISKSTLRRGADQLVREGLANYLTQVVPARTRVGTTRRRFFWLKGDVARLGLPSVFVSWAHAGRAWEDTLARFAKLLREERVNADIDLHHQDELGMDWHRYGPTQIRESDVVIVAVSKEWRQRWDGTNAPTVGAGAAAEADELYGIFSKNQDEFRRKVVLVVLPGATPDDVPNRLHGQQTFTIKQLDTSDKEFRRLVRTLKKQRGTSGQRTDRQSPSRAGHRPRGE